MGTVKFLLAVFEIATLRQRALEASYGKAIAVYGLTPHSTE